MACSATVECNGKGRRGMVDPVLDIDPTALDAGMLWADATVIYSVVISKAIGDENGSRDSGNSFEEV